MFTTLIEENKRFDLKRSKMEASLEQTSGTWVRCLKELAVSKSFVLLTPPPFGKVDGRYVEAVFQGKFRKYYLVGRMPEGKHLRISSTITHFTHLTSFASDTNYARSFSLQLWQLSCCTIASLKLSKSSFSIFHSHVPLPTICALSRSKLVFLKFSHHYIARKKKKSCFSSI